MVKFNKNGMPIDLSKKQQILYNMLSDSFNIWGECIHKSIFMDFLKGRDYNGVVDNIRKDRRHVQTIEHMINMYYDELCDECDDTSLDDIYTSIESIFIRKWVNDKWWVPINIIEDIPAYYTDEHKG